MDHGPSIELLESTHTFPEVYTYKAIGPAEGDFADLVHAAASTEIADPTGIVRQTRTTPSGRHVAVTLHVPVQDAAQVLAIYDRIRGLEGLKLLL
jgi:putative lipoic acid-binding regulatory protein